MENNNATATNSSTNEPSSTTPTTPEQQPYTAFDAGDTVILHSLIQSTHVNGRRGIIHSYPKITLADIQNPLVNDPNPNEPRCMVRLLPETTTSSSSTANNNSSNANPSADPYTLPETTSPFNIAQQCISIKTKNMTLDYQTGSDVKLFGLVGAKHYNERVARIVSYRVVKKNGKREPRYLVEVPTHDTDDYKKDDGDDTTSNVKQILVSPKNVIHLTGQKPRPVPVLDQRLIFTGSMKSIIKVLNQSVHKIPTPSDIFEMRGFNLLSDEDISDPGADMAHAMAMNNGNVPAEQQVELEQRGIEMALMAKQWGKIQMRSYKCRIEDTTAAEYNADDCIEGYNHLPPSYQRLQSTCPSMGRIHKICFNPKCYKIIPNPTSKQSKMKRCRKCNAVAYCNRDCAIEAWDYHRKVCKVIQNDNVKFADYVTLNSPKREEVMETQRMVRLCVNRIASLEDSDGHFQNKQSTADTETSETSTNNNTAKLVYDVMTQLGPDITNKILMMIENPPPQNREATVAVAFNSLGADPIYSSKDIQLFANIHDCSVMYQQQQVTKKKDEAEEVEAEDEKKGATYSDVVALEPNDDPLPGGGNIMGNVPDDVQEGFMNFMNGLIPGGMNGGMNGAPPDDGNNNGGGQGPQILGGGMMGGQGGAQFFMPQMGGGMMGGGPMDANGVMGMMGGAAGVNIMMGGPAGGGAQQFFMPGQQGAAVPPANANNNGAPLDNDVDIPEMGEELPLNDGVGDAQDDAQADANPNNEGNGNAANPANGNAAAAGGVQNVPPALANFLQHVLQETGVMPNAGNNNNNNNEDNGDNDDDEEDDDQPQVEDVADNNPNQQPQPPQPNQGNFPGPFGGMFGGAHVHVAQVNANDAANGAPPMPPPGAFFQVPGMPVGVQVAVAQAGIGIDGADDEGGMGGMPPQVAGLAGLQEWMGGGQGDEMNNGNQEDEIEEGEMEIED